MVDDDPIVHLNVTVFADRMIFQDLLTVSVNGSKNQRAHISSPVITGMDTQTGAARLGQHFLEDVAADQVSIGLFGMSVVEGFDHFGTGFSANMFSYGRAKRAGSSHGVLYILVHGIQFVGNE